MQCANCHFQNLPGSAVCGRCGTSLQLGDSRIDVHPPRASAWRKFLRRFRPRPRLHVGERVRSAAAHASSRLAGSLGSATQRLALFRLVFPGWSHWFLGQRGRGWFFAGAFLATLAPGLLFMGSTTGSMLLGLAFSVHVACIADLVNQFWPVEGARTQIARGLGLSAVVFTVLYLPVAIVVLHVADPQVVQMGMGRLREGDIVLVDHSAYRSATPAPGDVVMYNMAYRGPLHLESRRNPVYVYEGPRMDRILAGPGDRVSIRDGQVLVNDQPSALRPVNLWFVPAAFEVQVPDGHYLIMPSTTPNLDPTVETTEMRTLCLVPRSQILGRIRLRTYPLSRLGRL